MDLSDVIHKAVRERRQLSLRGKEDLGSRVVEPHIVYVAANGNVLVDFYQTSGYSSSGGLPAWRRLALTDILEASLLPQSFSPRTAEGYNPGGKRYVQIMSQIPLGSGR